MSGRFSDEQRTSFAALLDIILPAAHGLPSGNQVDIAGSGLDRVAKLRPDLVPEVLRAIRLFEQGSGLALLQADAEAWRAARLAAYAAYLLTPPVMARLGYSGQASQPVDPDQTPEYLLDGSLQQVINRGAMWRDPTT